MVDQRRPEEEPLRGHLLLTTVDHQGGTLPGAGADVARNLVAVLSRDQRTHVGVRVGAVADLELRQPGRNSVDQGVANITHRDGDGQRHTTLAC